jgi:hypothetical protein
LLAKVEEKTDQRQTLKYFKWHEAVRNSHQHEQGEVGPTEAHRDPLTAVSRQPERRKQCHVPDVSCCLRKISRICQHDDASDYPEAEDEGADRCYELLSMLPKG